MTDTLNDRISSTGTAEKPRAHSTHRLREIGASVLLGVLVVALLEVLSRVGAIPPLILPAPSVIFHALYDGLFLSKLLIGHILSTLGSTAAGFLIGMVLALVVASVLAVIPWFERICMPYIIALQTMPKIAIAPVLMLWFGYGLNSKLALVVAVAFFPMMLNFLSGLRVRDQDELDLMRSLGSTRWQIYRYIRIPNAMPFIFTGLHLGAIYSLLGATTAEFLGSSSGLGYVMLQQRAVFNTPGVFAILILLMIIGSALHMIMAALERRVVFWSQETSEAHL